MIVMTTYGACSISDITHGTAIAEVRLAARIPIFPVKDRRGSDDPSRAFDAPRIML